MSYSVIHTLTLILYNKFVDCAICANAKLIVTEDHHFDILKHCDFPRIPIMGLDEFKDLLQ